VGRGEADHTPPSSELSSNSICHHGVRRQTVIHLATIHHMLRNKGLMQQIKRHELNLESK
jgi:hypothetical protein